MKPASWRRYRPLVVEYVSAGVFVAAAALLTAVLRRYFPTTPNSLFFCAVILSAWLGGRGPGFLASVLSTLAILWLRPESLVRPSVASETVRFLMFLLAALFISWIYDQLKRAEAALRRAHDELEQRVQERTRELSAANDSLKAECARRQQAENALRESNHLLELVLATLPVGVAVTDKAGNTILSNAVTKRIWGQQIVSGPERWAQSKGFWHGSGRAVAPEEWASVRALTKGETSLNELIDIEAFDGRHKTIQNSCAPIRDGGGEIVGSVIVNEDVTDRVCGEEKLRQSEARLEEAQRVAHIGHWERDPVTDQIICSDEAFRIFGLSPRPGPLPLEELRQAIHPEDRPRQKQLQDEAQEGKRPYDAEYRVVWPDGQVRYVHALGTAKRDESGRLVLMFGTVQDITERKQTEQLLEGQRQILEMIAAGKPLSESLTALVRLIEERVPGMLGSILLLDKPGTHMLHGAAPNLPAEYVAAIDGTPIGPNVGSCGTAAYTRQPVFVEEIATDPRWQDYRAAALPHGLHACWSTPIFDQQQRVMGTFAMYYRQPGLPSPEHLRLIESTTHIAAIAISRDHDQAGLKESEAKLKEAQRIAKIGYWDIDLIADHVVWSEETWRIWGRQPGERPLTQAGFMEWIHPDDRKLRTQAMDLLIQKHRPYNVEYRIIRPDGKIRFVNVMDEAVFDKTGRPIRIFGTVQDITERKQAEARLRAQEQEIKAIVDNSPDPIVRYDRACRRTYVNPAFVKVQGVLKEALVGKTMGSTVHDGSVPVTVEELKVFQGALQHVLDTALPFDLEASWPLPDGRKWYAIHLEPEFDGQGSLVSVLSIGRDITNLKASQARLRQTEADLARAARIATMGELTASIAHEVNQPLAAVVTNANAITRWLAAAPPNLGEAREAVQRIARDGTRASEVIRRIRSLVKKSEPGRIAFHLDGLVKETVALVQSEIVRRRVVLEVSLASEPADVSADRVQLQQVLLNLLMNALDSMNAVADRPRRLRLRTSRPEPGTVQVSVEDTGVGIDPLQAAHLFDPFYTTKPDGLGMGLAISHSIIEAHGGRLWFDLNDGPGVTFKFTLPFHHGDAS